MKKWHKVLIAVLVFILAVVLAGVCVYHYYAKDKIEKTLEKAQTILQDEKLRKEIEGFADEMVLNGEMESSQLEGYLVYKDALENENKKTSPSVAPAPTATPKPKTLMERVKAEMTAEEFAFAMAMYGKIDVNFCLANYYTNRSAVKKHIKSRLTSDEISRSLEIYGKYSYILK